jgi:hypothetical protein
MDKDLYGIKYLLAFFLKKKQYRKTGRLGKLSCRFPFNQFWGKLVTKKCYGKK